MTYRWRSRPDGSVAVWSDGEPVRLELAMDAPGVRAVVERVERWRPLATRHARRTGVPVALLLGMIHAESGGDPDRREVRADGTPGRGEGLLQLTHPSLKAKVLPGESIYSPEVNVRIGADFAAELWEREKHDTPRTAAAYNAGRVQPGPEPWGMKSTAAGGTDHVTKVVAATNTYAARGSSRDGALLIGAAVLAAALALGGSHAE